MVPSRTDVAPAGVTQHEEDGAWVVAYRWSNPGDNLRVLATASIPLVVLLYAAFRPDDSPDGIVDQAFLAFMAVMFAFLVWGGAAWLLNESRVVVRSGRLDVAHGPIPWPWARGRMGIQPVAVVPDTGRVSLGGHGGGSIKHHVVAVLADGTRVPMIEGLRDAEAATWIARAVARRLS